MRFLDRADSPATQVIPIAIEHHYGRILALKHVDAVLRVGRYPAHHSERFSFGHLGKIAYQFVGVLARPKLCHCRILLDSQLEADTVRLHEKAKGEWVGFLPHGFLAFYLAPHAWTAPGALYFRITRIPLPVKHAG